MESIYKQNGLVFWTQDEINMRKTVEAEIVSAVSNCLNSQNKAWVLTQIEASLLTPKNLINPNYTKEDIFVVNEDLTLRPETTMGSYAYAKDLFDSQKMKMPFCVWQHGKSFRNEQNTPLTKMRLKEFYQLEFQCIYSLSTKNDYSEKLILKMVEVLQSLIGDCYLEISDRLPDYSEKTIDIVSKRDDMEVCSMSIRKDYPNAKVFEIAVGSDRCVYQMIHKKEMNANKSLVVKEAFEKTNNEPKKLS